MKNARITIVYELFRREGINIAILQRELQKRGYDVKIKNKYEQFSIEKNDVLIIPNAYFTADIENYVYRFNCKSEKIINLQVEQVFSKTDEQKKLWIAEGLAKNASFICWGNNRYQQMLNFGIDESNLKVCGALHTDSVKGIFYPLWKSREEIATEFALPKDKKWTLFISSFGFTADDSPYLVFDVNVGKDGIKERIEMERANQSAILQWFDDYLSTSSDVVIYRPHPTERNSSALKAIKEKYPDKFFVLSEYNIKQWIIVCDTITMWNSTSIIECYYAGKNCLVLRPYNIPDDFDYYLFDDCVKVKNSEQFVKAMKQYGDGFPITKEKLNEYYELTDAFVYLNICDEVERVLTTDKQQNLSNFFANRLKFFCKNHVLLKAFLKASYRWLNSKFGFELSESRLGGKFFTDEWKNLKKDRLELEILQEKMKEII